MKEYIASQVDYNINVVMTNLCELKNKGMISSSDYSEMWELLDFCSSACFDSVIKSDD